MYWLNDDAPCSSDATATLANCTGQCKKPMTAMEWLASQTNWTPEQGTIVVKGSDDNNVEVYVDGYFVNKTAKAVVNPKLIVALYEYDEETEAVGKLLAVKESSTPVTIQAYHGYAKINAIAPFEYGDAGYVKAFLWDSQTYQPLCESAAVAAEDLKMVFGQIPTAGWSATASYSTGVSSAFDGNITTRWTSNAAQVSNGSQWYRLDLGAVHTFNQVLLNDNNSGDYPRGYALYVSNDDATWGDPVVTGAGSGGTMAINFGRQTARYIRIVQTGTATSWWSIHDIGVYNNR
jgi:hypothetical protein